MIFAKSAAMLFHSRGCEGSYDIFILYISSFV